MEYHEYANLFPMMSSAEIKELCADMIRMDMTKHRQSLYLKEKYLTEEIDSWRPIPQAVMPNYIDFTGDDPVAFVIRHNLHRRHLNETQRAVIASKIANMKIGN